MLKEEERARLEQIISENVDRRNRQKELQKYLDKMLEQIIAEEGRSNESKTRT